MSEIKGKTDNLKKNQLNSLNALFDIHFSHGQLVAKELAEAMGNISLAINKEISVLVNRSGQVVDVTVGSDTKVDLPDLKGRRGQNRLSGFRCIHTHPHGLANLSNVDIAALKNAKFDAMVTIGLPQEDLKQVSIFFGMITSAQNQEPAVEEFGPFSLEEAENINFTNLINTVERLLSKNSDTVALTEAKERAMLVSLEWGKTQSTWQQEDSLEELGQLALTAGAEVINKFLQKRPKPDPAFFIGRGKVDELALYAQQENIDLCIFDEELSPVQQRNLEQAIGVRILDRTALILDIFAQRAKTNEGKMQVELAQLKYTLPRIMGQGSSLSRLGGGIGTRGPGETKLEVDRRKIRERIALLEEQIEKWRNVRHLQRVNRTKKQVLQISLVGYTNAGKSTLLNKLTNDNIYAKDQLFATLDPTTRQLSLPDKQEAVLTDTVGFIQRLPHQLVAAFRSTLEEVADADILLHVVDCSHELYKEQMEAVFTVLKELQVLDKTIITAYNKVDRLQNSATFKQRIQQEDDAVCISAVTGYGLSELLNLLANKLSLQSVTLQLLIPYAEQALVAKLHSNCTVLAEDYKDNGTLLKVKLASDLAKTYEKYIYKN